jgi:integrase
MVQSLKPGPVRTEFWDTEVSGLCVRVTPQGTKSWSFLFRSRDGGPKRRFTIGDYPAWSLKDARERALVLRQQVQSGLDPVVERRRSKDALTLQKIAESYARHVKAKLRSGAEYEAMLNRHLLPKLGDRKAADLKRADIVMVLDELGARAPVSANRLQAVTSAMFSWAVDQGLLEASPIIGLAKRSVEHAKERTLSDDEIRRFWSALDGMADAYRDALRMILLTGQRPGECAGIRAEEVDVNSGLWTIPATRVKNKREQVVPLVGDALALIERLRGRQKHGTLLATPRGLELTPQNLAKAFERLPKGTLDADATPHDLRRTAATLMARLGTDRLHVAAVLNHASTTRATVTGAVYDRHTYLPEKTRALSALDREIQRILSGKVADGNIVPLRSGNR